MKAKIDTKDAAALVEVRGELKDAWRKAAEAWTKRWAGAISEDQLAILEIVAIHEINEGAFIVLLQHTTGAEILQPSGVMGTREAVKDLFRKIQREKYDD